MKKNLFRKGMSALLAVMMCLSAFIGMGTTTAFAAEAETDEVVMMAFPREGDDNYSANWGHGKLHYMNGWFAGDSKKVTVYTIGSWNGNACYCIEPGTPLAIGDVMTKRDENYWDNYPSTYNKTIEADEIKLFIGRIFQYGYTGKVSTEWRSQNAADADKLAHIMATQTLVWETVVGERDSDFNHVDPGSYDAVKDRVATNHPLYSQFISYYNSMEANVQKHSKVPSFFAKSTSKAQEIELAWNGTNYSATLTDTNNVLGKGITGTSYKKRDEFNRMIRRCKQGKIDMIIVKSIARFARNTVDCLKFVRMLNDLGVVVYFEEQGIYTNQPGAEFYITIYGCIAQSESENISANVKWGKARSAKEGNVPFHYKNFLGYRKGADGKPEIDPEEAETVRFIYERFLAGDSLGGIAQKLEDMQIPSPKGKAVWSMTTIQSILSNEKYKGDAVINKTYIKDCLSKKVMVNNGERPKYYIENNHPAIIDAVTFGRVQEELARRAGKPKTKKVGTKTEQGKYSSKYAMTELLVCGECKTPYRRCTWTVKGQKKIVWRCINRLDFGKKYCHNSPTVEESILQRAVMRAIMETAQQNLGVLQTLKVHIGMALENEPTEDNSMELQIRIAEIDAEFKAMLSKISTETVDAFDEEKAKRLMDEKVALQQQLADIQDGQLKREKTQTRLDDIYTILDGLKNRPMEYDEQIVRQLLECITVDSKEQITVIFVGGLKVVQPLID